MASGLSRLSVLTWNVWFDALQKRTRYEEIFKVCRTLAPDIVCFQEATPFFLTMLKEHEHSMKELYSFSDYSIENINPYGVISLCRKDLCASFKHFEMTTDMNRKLLITHIETSKGEIVIGNVHLESLDSAPTRRDQLKLCSRVLTGSSASILCGDFNFCSDHNYHEGRMPLENETLQQILPSFVDVWPLLRPPTERGYTFDTTANLMLDSNRHEQFRFDRVMLSSPGGQWAPTSIQIVGNVPVGENVRALEEGWTPPEVPPAAAADPEPAQPAIFSFLTPVKSKKPSVEPVLFPSDHFGLFAVFEHTDIKNAV